jgi:DNA anti-recombination protein RmuC
MSKDSHLLSEVGIFLAGAITAGLLTARRTEPRRAPADAGSVPKGVEEEQNKVTEREAALAARLAKIEERLEQHEARLAEIPSTQQIVAAMEQLISKMVSSLDERFKSQAQSIEALKGSVTETDGLLERVLESLDSLQSAEPLELTDENLLERPAP